MNTATAKAKSTKPDNRAFTATEAVKAIQGCSPTCGLSIAWRAVEEFGIAIQPPRCAGDQWLAVWREGAFYVFGDTALEAVEDLLREIGGWA